ncbi:MAG: hypothetical protein U0168_22340 [Nannocystaceae bacterium]
MLPLLLLLATEDPGVPREITWPDGTAAVGAAPVASVGPEVLTERCDGSRSRPATDAAAAACARWKIEWSRDGRVWGVTAASSLAAVTAERERILGFARQHARLFDLPFDARWSEPTPPICDTCEANLTGAVAGEGPAGDANDPIRKALLEVRGQLAAFESTVLDTHAPRLREIARLAHGGPTARLAKAYAKALEAAVVDVTRLQLELDNAAVFRTKADIDRTKKSIELRAAALDKAASALLVVVAKSAADRHAGAYTDDAVAGPGAAQLVVEVTGTKVLATFIQGEARAAWFDGTVELDGSFVGKTLVAPEGTALACSGYSVECGYVWAPAQLRFDDRPAAKGTRHTVELWFQQGKWVHARPFSR